MPPLPWTNFPPPFSLRRISISVGHPQGSIIWPSAATAARRSPCPQSHPSPPSCSGHEARTSPDPGPAPDHQQTRPIHRSARSRNRANPLESRDVSLIQPLAATTLKRQPPAASISPQAATMEAGRAFLRVLRRGLPGPDWALFCARDRDDQGSSLRVLPSPKAQLRDHSLPRFQNRVSPELSSTPSLSVTTQAFPAASKASPSTLSTT